MAGAMAAAVPVIVHLLNRRRFQVIEWGAMDFLLEAVSRSRRIFELRDLLLLLLRLLCLLLFGLALSRPFWNRAAQTTVDPNRPVHAVLLIDNSLSTGYEKTGGNVLSECKTKARQVIEGLPRGSLISVIPISGSAAGINYEAYATTDEALEALASIKPVDRSAQALATVDLATEACRRNTKLSAKRIVLIADQQITGWSADPDNEQLKQLPAPLQFMEVTSSDISNAWVADVQLQDGVADTESPGIVLATIGYQGKEPRENVQLTLKIDGVPVSSETVSLQPNQSREVQFPEYRFAVPIETGKTNYSTIEVALPPDQLPADDQRVVVVPVVASLPVVFIDNLGEEENPSQGLYGDTFWLRRLLAPQLAAVGQNQPLIQIRRLKLEQLSQESLADVRLVVIAGVTSPSAAAMTVLGEYVEQGGNLIVSGGGNFNPVTWNDIGWNEGHGILPAALEPATVGRLREESGGKSDPFVFDFDSLVHEYFRPDGVSDEELRGLYGPPTLFFKSLVPIASEQVESQSVKAASDYFGKQADQLSVLNKQLSKLQAAGGRAVGGEQLQQQTDLLKQIAEIQPAWLGWRKQDGRSAEEQRTTEEIARRARPTVLARLNNGTPLLVRRYWGRGVVLLFSSSLSPQWTTMPDVGQSWWLMDRIVRSLLTDTLPVRNLSTEGGFVLPVAPNERSARYTLTSPSGEAEALSVDALGNERYGINLGNWTQRGIYRVSAARGNDSAEGAPGEDAQLWELPLAVNGPADESELVVSQLGKAAGGRTFVAVAGAGATVKPPSNEDVDIWKWLIGLVLCMLLLELYVAAKSTPRIELAR